MRKREIKEDGDENDQRKEGNQEPTLYGAYLHMKRQTDTHLLHIAIHPLNSPSFLSPHFLFPSVLLLNLHEKGKRGDEEWGGDCWLTTLFLFYRN